MRKQVLPFITLLTLLHFQGYVTSGEPVGSIGMNQKSQTFTGDNFHVPHKSYTYRQSGMAGISTGQGPRDMKSLASKHPSQELIDNFFLAYHSFYLPSEFASAPNSWELLYDTEPQLGIAWTDYFHYGVVTRFSKRGDNDFQKQETTSFAQKCESVHGMTASNDGKLVALLCRGYPGADYLKEAVKTPFPGAPFTDLTPTGGFTNGPHLASMYILEFHNGQISTNPDHVIRVSQAAGGWSYANNEIDYVCEVEDGCVCTADSACQGGQYFVQIKVQTNNPDNRHENIYKFIVNRPGKDDSSVFTNQFARESCGGGHPMGNRKAYNSVDKAWGSTCYLDACIDENNPNPDPANSSCHSAYLNTLPSDSVGRSHSNYSSTFMNHFLQNRGLPFTSSGGAFSLLSLGQDGYMALLSGPGDTQVESPKVGFYIQKLGGEGTSSIVKWNIDAPLLEAHGITDTGRFGYVKASPYGVLGAENYEQTSHFLIGFSPQLDPNGSKAKPNVYMVGQYDRNAELTGDLLKLNSAGWGENNNWASLPSSGCVAFAFAWKSGIDGNPGYPKHSLILVGEDTNPEETMYLNRGFTKDIQLTTICPDEVPMLADLIYKSAFE